MAYYIKYGDFELHIETEFFTSYPVNTYVNIKINSNTFSAITTMETSNERFESFADDLAKMYSLLNGKAELSEIYGLGQFIRFTYINNGHILFEGMLEVFDGSAGDRVRIKFEKTIDQSCLANLR